MFEPRDDDLDVLDVQSVAGTGPHPLDAERMQALHRQLMGFWYREKDRQAPNRREMAEDHDFYDNIQWTDDEKRELADIEQLPIFYNIIASTVNWVIGTEKRGKSDFKVLPREKEDQPQAQIKTKVLKYLSDVNRTPFERSRAFEDAAKGGIGWLETGVSKEDDGEPIYTAYESWRNILHDSSAQKLSLSDARYIFRQKWTDLDIAYSMFQDRKAKIRLAAEDAFGIIASQEGDDAMDAAEIAGDQMPTEFGVVERQRVRLIECWFKKPTKVKRIGRVNAPGAANPHEGEIYDADDWRHQFHVSTGGSLSERTMMVMHVAIMTASDLLYVAQSPYRHNEFPFTPIWCYRRNSDGMPYGIIRGLKSMQQDVNKRASKALAILCSNKVIMDEGAVDDMEEFRKEVSRPNSIIEKEKGSELKIDVDRDLADGHFRMMGQTIALMQTVSGITDENLGRETNASAGVAIARRQDQGMLVTAGPFDNLRLAAQLVGEKELSLSEQYMTERKVIRLTNMRGKPEFVTINDDLPENDITRSKADFVISEEDWRASVRQAQAEELLGLLKELAPTAPQIALVLLDLVVESMDVSQRDEIVKRIRQFTGMPDPDAPGPTPEQQQKAQEQAEAKIRAVAMEVATIAEKQASAQQKLAAAGKSGADAKLSAAKELLSNMQAMMTAMEAALAAVVTADAAPIADQLLLEGGWKGAADGTFEGPAMARVPMGIPSLVKGAAHPNQIPISPGATAAPALEGA